MIGNHGLFYARPMKIIRNQRDIKNFFAIFAIGASLLFSLTLVVVANSRDSYWVATRALTPGHMVDSLDFKAVKADFGIDSSGYLPATRSPIGYSIARFVAPGEYLNQVSLVENSGESNVRLLSFAVAAPDLPSSIKIGDAINIYQVVNDNGEMKSVPSTLVIENVFIVDLNRKSESLGGLAIVTVGIPNDFVERALNATRKGRMVVVINHG